MTEKRLFVGRKTVEDRFTIINDYENEIGVKENRSGDVLVLKHSDLNAQQFVAQLVVFLNDQNQAIVDLYDGSKYWSDKATEKIKALEKENEQLKQQLQKIQNNFEVNWTQNHIEFDKDKLYIKDNNTEIHLDGTNLFIEVYIPQIDEYYHFKYKITGRSLMTEFIENYNSKEDME